MNRGVKILSATYTRKESVSLIIAFEIVKSLAYSSPTIFNKMGGIATRNKTKNRMVSISIIKESV